MLNGHGGNINKICNAYGLNPEEIIDFSASINPLGYPDSVRKAVLKRFDDILNYPDSECTSLRKVIAETHSCNESNIIIGNGSNELFYLIPRALKPKRGIILQPAFSEFKDALRNANIPITDIINNNPVVLSLNDPGFKNISNGMVFLCNPNNPTGHLIQKEQILKLARDNPKQLIVVDEAFMDFVEDEGKHSLVKEAPSVENLIVVRSLTKFYGFPGLRLGYLVATESITNNLLQFKEPWTVNALAQVAGKAALYDKMFALNTRSFISTEKEFLYKSLSEIKGLYPFYPSVNFILVRVDIEEMTSSKIFDLLIEDNIIIRDCSNFAGLDNKYFRVAVRTREENQSLLNLLRNVMNNRTVENANEKKHIHDYITK